MIRLLSLLALLLLVVASSGAFDLGNRALDKPEGNTTPPPADPDAIRQGGDTILDATVIQDLPFSYTGTTAGYNHDYDEVCPFTGSTSPDVVYTFTLGYDMNFNVDMFGSAYDTKIYVYDENLNLVACNDDYYPDYTSFLENVAVVAGVQYFLVIDGYGGDFGDYVVSTTFYVPCLLDCPPEGVPEGEPPLQDDQINAFNDGCGSDNPDGFQDISGDAAGSLVLCGTSGWFLYDGSDFRDTDWFVATFGPDGIIELTADAEWPLYVFELGPQDCANVGVVQQIEVGPCATASMTVTGEPFSTVWLWTGPTTFASPVGSTPFEFDYTIWFSGLAPEVVATEPVTWSGVRALFH